VRFSKKMDKLPPYLFVEINKKIAQKRANGVDIISFAIGDPDLPTPAHIIDKICEEARNPINHRYPETSGMPELCQAIAKWYKDRFGVVLDPAKEILPLLGSKEGIGHISFCLLDPGDIALITDPGYPVYSTSTLLAGGEPYFIKLTEENGFLPDLGSIPKNIAEKANVLWLNYPNNPTGATAGLDFFERAIKFAKKYDIVICHDAPYTEVAFDGYKPHSFMEAAGAKDVAVEFHSLSKTYDMTGWRIGMAVGNPKMIDALFRFKSNLDSGIPQAIQFGAIAGLTGSQDSVAERNKIYQRRRDKLVKALKEMGIRPLIPKATFYIWAKVPDGYTSVGLTTELLDQANIAVTPGTGYGKAGEGYVRLSITLSDERLEEGIRRLLAWRK
jgi:LL-diaminopimelate aminotransferase